MQKQSLQFPSAPAPPQVPVPDGIPAPLQELGYTGQRMLNQCSRSMNGILQGGNPVVEMISGVQGAVQNIPLPVEILAQIRRGMRNARFPFAELDSMAPPAPLGGKEGSLQFPKLPGMPALGDLQKSPGTPTGNRETPEKIPVW